MHYAVTVIGADRPGIVAAVAEALRDVGGNLEDVSSTILRGHFSMVLVVNAPEEVDPQRLRGTLEAAGEPLGVAITVRDVEAGAPDRPQATHVLTAYGSDHPGIVARLTRLLADRGVNVTDLTCRLVGEEKPVYAMIAEVSLPDGVDPEEVGRLVEEAGRELSVDATFRSIEVETL